MSEMKRTIEAIFDSYEIEIRMLEESINRVRELHKPNGYNECIHCLEITELGGYDYLSDPTVTYPCSTIIALDGKQ
jgi:hypothetical protein